MRKIVFFVAFLIFQIMNEANAQTIESLIKELPPYFQFLLHGAQDQNGMKNQRIFIF